MKKSLWYTLGVIAVGVLLYFVLGWLTSLLLIVLLTSLVFVVYMVVRRRLNKQ